KKSIVFLSAILWYADLSAQLPKTIVKTRTVVSQREIVLNGGARSEFGGKSRTSIKIDLPKGTKEWYYSFTTEPGPSGTQLLNLALQLSALTINPTGISGLTANDIKIPEGVSVVDAMVLDAPNNDLFLSKADLQGKRCLMLAEGSADNTKQAAVKIDDVTAGTWFLALKNPSALNAVYVKVEVVAIVEEILPPSPGRDKAMMLADLASKAYRSGDMEKSMELNNRALSYDSTQGWIWGNIGLIQLTKNDYLAAVDAYINAVELSKADPEYGTCLQRMIQDLNSLIKSQGNTEGAKEIKEILQKEQLKMLDKSIKQLADLMK
ncbi:MAG: hypothetical protein DI539_28375, partial [Flavobacterium psychrophilum]